MKNKITLNDYEVEFESVNGEIAAYVDGGEEASITASKDEVIANYVEDARNSDCGEDALYEAIENAKLQR